MCGYLLQHIAGWLEVTVTIAKITRNYVMVHFKTPNPSNRGQVPWDLTIPLILK